MGVNIYTSNPSSSTGTVGFLTGEHGAVIALQCIGNNQFLPLNYIGTITPH
jgi:hypothetical protein